jgi:LuxR family maltose regulon positive regulatory protein
LGLAYLSRGPVEEAGKAFRQVAVANQATSFVLFRVLAAVGEGCAHRMAGTLDGALAAFDQAGRWSTEHAHPSLLDGSLYTGMADILRERNQLDAALDQVTKGLRLSAELGAASADRWIEWHVCDLLVLARIKLAQDDPAGALTVVHEARDRLKGLGVISFAAILAAFEAQIQVAQGDLDPAVRWLRSTEAPDDPPRFGLTPQFFIYAVEHLQIAPVQVLLAQGRASGDLALVHRALVLLDQLRERAERTGMVWLHGKSLALQALAHQLLGEPASTLAALDQALALAQPGGHARLFIDEGLPMADLLRRLSGRCSAPDHLAAILAAGRPRGLHASIAGEDSPPDDAPTLTEHRSPLTEPVTERELEVLRLVAAGQSNPEIARTLYVEVNTIKTHVKSLYDKLGVHSRVQAAQRAQELGLL